MESDLDADFFGWSLVLKCWKPTCFSRRAGQAFNFPTNPNHGYIDGSVYIQHAHHPVDVTSIRYGREGGTAIESEIDLVFVLEFEGFSDWTLIAQLTPELASSTTGETGDPSLSYFFTGSNFSTALPGGIEFNHDCDTCFSG